MPLYSDLNIYTPKIQPLQVELRAIYQSMDSIIRTRKGDRLFRPDYGLDLEEYLFDLIDDTTSTIILLQISQQLAENEPRVEIDLTNSRVIGDPDNHTYDILLTFSVVGAPGIFEYQGIIG